LPEKKTIEYSLPGFIPRHIAIIMDGNGRWAKKKGLPRLAGHKAGVDSVRNIVRFAGKIGVKYLTLYTFSTENWARPVKEVSFLMKMMNRLLETEVTDLDKNNVKLKIIGNRSLIEDKFVKKIEKAENKLKNNTGLNLILALSYGGRDEIIHAVKRIIENVKNGKDIDIDEDEFKNYLYTEDIPDPELVIRTSGEYRLSNFLVYQAAYSEIYITKTLWPDFNENSFTEAIEDFNKRERRFGKV